MKKNCYIKLTMQFHKEDDQWVGECSELGTSTFGDTLDQVESELTELIELHLNTLEEMGERDKFLREIMRPTIKFSPNTQKTSIVSEHIIN